MACLHLRDIPYLDQKIEKYPQILQLKHGLREQKFFLSLHCLSLSYVFLFVPLTNFLSWVMTFLSLFIKLSLGLGVKQRPGIVIAADSRYKRTGGRE